MTLQGWERAASLTNRGGKMISPFPGFSAEALRFSVQPHVEVVRLAPCGYHERHRHTDEGD